MSQLKTFYCLRCQHRFAVEYEKRRIVERSCPKCGSNSVRIETPKSAAAAAGKEAG